MHVFLSDEVRKKLREAGIIKRIGADYGGHWGIITSDKQ